MKPCKILYIRALCGYELSALAADLNASRTRKILRALEGGRGSNTTKDREDRIQHVPILAADRSAVLPWERPGKTRR